MACWSWSTTTLSNLTELTIMGLSLAAFSGGKGFRGPQCTELVVGTFELVWAVRVYSSPESGSGRRLKIGEEKIMGLLAAVVLFLASGDGDLARREANVSVKRRGQRAHPDLAPLVRADVDPERRLSSW